MVEKNDLNNPINLNKIKKEYNIFSKKLMIKDDIWKKGILILRGGRYLTEEIIDKLINFGIYEVNVHTNEENTNLDNQEIENQNIFIVEKEFKDISMLVRELINLGFNEKNIFGITVPKLIDRYFKHITPSYLFIDFGLFAENKEIFLKEFEYAKNKINNINIFLTINQNEINRLKVKNLENTSDYLEKKLIIKPIIKSHLTHLLNQCLTESVSYREYA